MFLDYQFCEDNCARIEKVHHLASYIADDRKGDLNELMHDMGGIQTQMIITPETKALADFLDEAYESKMADYQIKNELFNKGYHKGIVLEITIYAPNKLGRPILYVYAESELEVRAFMEKVSATVWENE